jgi:hypothetical protein
MFDMHAGEYVENKESLPHAFVRKVIEHSGSSVKERKMGDLVELDFRVDSEGQPEDSENDFSYFEKASGQDTLKGFRGITEKTHEGTVYSQRREISDLVKQTFFICFPNKRRYVISRTSYNPISASDISGMIGGAEDESSLRTLLDELRKDATYVHIIYVKDQEKVAEVE